MGSRSDITAEITALAEVALAAGWRQIPNRRNRWKLAPPDRDRPMVVCSRVTGDIRTVKNFRSQLRRSGLEV